MKFSRKVELKIFVYVNLSKVEIVILEMIHEE